MLFRNDVLESIRAGAITVAFRRWRKPSVRAGSTLLTSVGQLTIKSVTKIALTQISKEDAHLAGYQSREALLEELQRRPEGEVYRIELGPLRPDPRIALRKLPATELESHALRDRLHRLDVRASDGAWTLSVLRVLSSHSGVRAGDLCHLVGQEKEQFKLNVRKLKNLGLVESLQTGYRLSPRGEALLKALLFES
ncbi:MAG TPA: hypothetical protein VF701_19085 [Thermoanaerobaculia bacterium]